MQADPIRLRDFVREDIADMYALDQVCFRRGISYSRAEFEYLTGHASSFTLIAETPDHRLAGFAIAQRTVRRRVMTGHIVTIDVDHAYRRRGVGRLLMEALEDKLVARGVRRCALEVAIDDPGAQEFYSGLGYHTTARLRAYYMGNLDAMRMEKELIGTRSRT